MLVEKRIVFLSFFSKQIMEQDQSNAPKFFRKTNSK